MKCDDNLSEIEEDSMLEMSTEVKHEYEYGTQKMTCYDCMKNYCCDCASEDEGSPFCMSDVCGICNRRCCFHCSREGNCTGCDRWFCVDCMDMKECDKCDENKCIK